MSLDGGLIKQLCPNQSKEEIENSSFDTFPNVAFRVTFGKTYLNTSKENNNVINHFPLSTSETRGIWTVLFLMGFLKSSKHKQACQPYHKHQRRKRQTM